MLFYNIRTLLVILRFDLEICLWMVANGANFRCRLADNNVSAVGALPNAVAFT